MHIAYLMCCFWEQSNKTYTTQGWVIIYFIYEFNFQGEEVLLEGWLFKERYSWQYDFSSLSYCGEQVQTTAALIIFLRVRQIKNATQTNLYLYLDFGFWKENILVGF